MPASAYACGGSATLSAVAQRPDSGPAEIVRGSKQLQGRDHAVKPSYVHRKHRFWNEVEGWLQALGYSAPLALH